MNNLIAELKRLNKARTQGEMRVDIRPSGRTAIRHKDGKYEDFASWILGFYHLRSQRGSKIFGQTYAFAEFITFCANHADEIIKLMEKGAEVETMETVDRILNDIDKQVDRF
uniref:Uncharacterized protein n=1 Tax=viral metagenome TaxID=1070528 RepID=A0A6H1ZL80_9ZZZZ